MRSLVYAAAALLIVPLVAVACSGCTNQLAGYIVRAPNHGLSLADVEAKGEQEPLGREPEQAFRVEVGPPEASLAVRVLDPAETPMMGLKVRPKDGGGYSFHLIYAPEEMADDAEPADAEAADAEAVDLSVPDEPRGTILVLHGLFGSKDTLPALWARMLTGSGYRAVLVDMRGHGQSTGQWLTYGVRESRDLSQVIDELGRRGLIAGRIGVFGISYGGATGIQLAANDPRVEAVVALAPFASLERAVPDFARGWLGPLALLVPPPVMQGAVQGTQRLTEVAPTDVTAAMSELSAPVLLIHGAEDKHVPADHSRQLYEAGRRASHHLMILDNENHMTLAAQPHHSLKELRDHTLAWFDNWLKSDPSAEPRPLVETADRASEQQ